jgi:hypothetical protein
MTAMQRLGYAYCGEDVGVFGVHRHGPGIVQRLGSLSMWSDCIAWFDRAAVRKAGANPTDIFFRGLAYRMVWGLSWDFRAHALSLRQEGLRDDGDRPTGDELALLRAFAEAEPRMRVREILPDERGVLYRDGAHHLLWAFASYRLDLGTDTTIHDVLAGTTCTLRLLEVEPRHVYCFDQPCEISLS